MNHKITLFIVLTAVTVAAVFAEAPELRNVMPNSWRKLTRLSASAERAFFAENVSPYRRTKYEVT